MISTSDIIARLSVGAGATIDAITGKDIKTGYAVASNIQLRVPDRETLSFLPVIEEFINIARDRYSTLRSWRARGFREYEVTYVIEDRDVAILVARQRGEQAIYDLANGVEIPTN